MANQGAGYDIYGATSVDFTGRGEALGFEVLNRWNLDKFSLLASYTYVKSSFTDINDKFIPSSWDSRHLLTMTGTTEFAKNWRAGFKWRYVGGLPYTPYDLDVSSNVQAWDANGQAYLDFKKLNSLRFNAFHQLDLRIDKYFFFNKWSLMVYLDVQNVYNFKNIGRDFVIRKKDANGSYIKTNNDTQYLLESVPNENGTVLPTIGIRIMI